MDIRVVEEKGRSQIEVTILSGPDDQRVSGLVNLDYVTGISPAGSGRILLSLSEKNLIASRKYASDIKNRIGIL